MIPRLLQEGRPPGLTSNRDRAVLLVAFLAREKLKHRSIKTYLSAVRFLHIAEGKSDPFLPCLTHLQYVLRGVKRCENLESNTSKERLPISPNLLKCLKEVWNSERKAPNRPMLWAPCCIAFFGFLRIGEMVVPSKDAYDPSVHLHLSDVSVDNSERPTVLKISIKQSKTDPFRKGVDLFLGKTDTDICPVRALINYLVQRGISEGPLFILEDGTFLTRHYFVSAVRGGTTETRSGSVEILWSQLPHRGSHYCSSKRDGGLDY